MMAHCVSVRNRYIVDILLTKECMETVRDGYRNDDALDLDQLAIQTKQDMQKSQDVRTAALMALFRLEAKTRLQRASRGKARQGADIQPGNWVFLHRRNAFGRVWREGPGVVLMTAGTSTWISIHGELLKVAKENLALASSQEIRGIEEINEALPSLREAVLAHQRRRRYRDLSQEVVPTEEEAIPRTPRTPQTTIPSTQSQSSGLSLPRTRSASVMSGEDQTPNRTRRSMEPHVAEAVARLEASEVAPSQPSTDMEIVSTAEQTADLEQLMQQASGMERPTGEVVYGHLNLIDKKQFDTTIAKEVDSMLHTNQALLPLSVQESQQVLEHRSDRVVDSRFHLKWKEVDDAQGVHFKAKCRWILQGHKDPDAVDLDGRSPAPTMASINLLLMACASLHFEVHQGDLSEAFLQGKMAERELYVKQPPEGVPGLQPSLILRLQKEIYGSVLGPSSWRQTLIEVVMDLGWLPASCDECIFVLRSTTERPSHGVQASQLLSQST